jgi:transcriptional regulator with XRE-family HTH domain
MQQMSNKVNSAQLSVEFGEYVRERRTNLAASDKGFSLRQVALRCGVTPAYLSRVERGEVGPPGEDTLLKLAKELKDDPDVLMAMAGKVSTDLRSVIMARPKIFAELIRQLKDAPDDAVVRIVREIKDGNW